MGFLQPAYTYLIILPFLFLSTIPILLLATASTILAFSLLFLRVLLIYIDLALAVIPHYLSLFLLGPTRIKPTTPLPRARSFTSTTSRRKRRRGSSVSATGTITPISSSVIGLSQSVGPARDFEGVGGWRLGGEDNEDEDALWTSINSRLELPAEHGRRNHRRSFTSGSAELVGMNTGRLRTPPARELEGTYFPSTPKGGSKRTSGNGTNSSGSSKNSSMLGMKGR